MSYPLVQKLLSPSNSDVTKILDSEKLVGSVSWKDLVGGAELVFNFIDCIETTVQGFKDEKSLEKEARKLLKQNRFLAGKVFLNKIVEPGSIFVGPLITPGGSLNCTLTCLQAVTLRVMSDLLFPPIGALLDRSTQT